MRLAPGVRVSVSSRGVRAHVGPRAARLHVGGGRTGVSTGMGPVTYYTSVGSGSRRRASQPARVTAPTPAQQEKAALALALAEEIESLCSRHTYVTFPLMTRPVAELPAIPSGSSTMATHLKAARAGVPWHDIKGRWQARKAAQARAAVDDRELAKAAELERRNRQEDLDAFWERLRGNDPDTVMQFVQRAFEDNADPAAIVGIDGDEAYVVVAAPSDSVVPDRKPGVTPTGRPAIRKMPAKEVAALHQEVVAGTIVITLMETFAVAPGLASVKLAAIDPVDGGSLLWNVRVRRGRLDSCRLGADSSVAVLDCAADENDVRLLGASRRLGALDPARVGWSELENALVGAREESWS